MLGAISLCDKTCGCHFYQEASTSALANMATFLDRESQEPMSDSVEYGAAGMCGAIGNLLSAASDAAVVKQVLNNTNLTSSQADEQQNNTDDKRARVSVLFL